MKKITTISLALLLVTMFGCKQNKVELKPEEVGEKKIEYHVFGDSIANKNVLTPEEMYEKYISMNVNDTILVQFKSNIDGVCQKKGCWVKLNLKDNAKSFVKFKDYAFFAPMNSKDHQAIVSGKAYINIIPVDQLKHYAKDAGKTEEEIGQITEPKVTYAFMADGIKISIK